MVTNEGLGGSRANWEVLISKVHSTKSVDDFGEG